MTMEDVQEEIRQMKWDLRILRDQAMSIADQLPAEDRERLCQISERITDATRDLIAAVRLDEVESEATAVERLLGGISEVQEQLKLIAHELHEVADGLISN
jgi:hypothetical protein